MSFHKIKNHLVLMSIGLDDINLISVFFMIRFNLVWFSW